MNQTKKTLNIVVTGGNTGIGLETVKQLYLNGNNIIFGSRNEKKNQMAIEEVLKVASKSSKGSEQTPVLKSFSLDLAKAESINKFASQVKREFSAGIDILINNAGLILKQFSLSELDIEMILTVNHFGHFLLTHLLFDLIKKQPQARIINVSSLVHSGSPDNMLEDLACKTTSFGQMDQYKKSKFFNVLFTVELKRKMEKYPNIKTFSLHPGVVATDFVQDVGYLKCFYALAWCFTANPEDGARTSIYLATEDFNKLQNGEYYDSNTKHVEMDKRARDPVLGEKLWKISEQAYKIKFSP